MSKVLRNMVVRIALIVFALCTIMCWFFMSIEFSFMMQVSDQGIITGVKVFLDQEGHFEEYASSVMETYRSIPEEIRQNPHSDEYRAFFEQYNSDEYVGRIAAKLCAINNMIGFQNVYVVADDAEHEAYVYLMDVSSTPGLYPLHEVGEWVPMTQKQQNAFYSESSEFSVETKSGLQEADAAGVYSYISFESSGDVPGRIQTVGVKAWDLGEGTTVYILCAMPILLTNTITAIFVVIYFAILTIAIILIVVVTRIRMRKRVITPINSISGAVEEYARQRKEGKTLTTCFSDLSINTGDELEDLAETLSQMEKDLSVYEQDLKSAVAREERMNTELSVATDIQSSMLPDAKTSFRDRKDFAVSAAMTPAREVGGDFYDFFLIDDDHLGLVIADVSGKGIPAALFMMSSMIIINNFASMGFSPREVLERSNEKICASNELNMFVTVWFGILDLKTGVVTAANAGHEYPALCGAGGDFKLLHDDHGFVLGGIKGMKYEEYTFTMEKGGTLYLYTDGVPEATDASEELYGTDRMLRALSKAADKSPEGLDEALRADIDAFIAGAPQFDDLTTLCVQYLPEASADESKEQHKGEP